MRIVQHLENHSLILFNHIKSYRGRSSAMKSNQHKTHSGFTLIELVLVIIIIGLFSTIAIMKTRSGLDTIRSNLAIDQLTVDIDCARTFAFGQNDTITVVFSVANDNYSFYSGHDASRTLITNFPNSDSGVISLKNDPYYNDITSANFNGSNELQFFPLGEVKSGGTITIDGHTISIENVTGNWSLN